MLSTARHGTGTRLSPLRVEFVQPRPHVKTIELGCPVVRCFRSPVRPYLFAKALADGRGAVQDRFQAYVWFLVAFDASYPAGNDLKSLKAVLSPDQIDQAKATARRLEDSVTRSIAAHGCTGWSGEFSEIPAPPPPPTQRFCR